MYDRKPKKKSINGQSVRKNDRPIKVNKRIRTEISSDYSENAVFGRNSVMELLRSERTVDKLFVLKGDREGSVTKIIAMAKEKHIVVVEAEKAKLDKMSGNGNHQGVLALTTEFEYCEVEDILACAEEKGEKPLILIIDGINDPGNLGAIIRTANASGVHGIILPKRGSCGMTSAVFKSAAGACEYVNIARVTNINDTIKMLQDNGVWIYGTDGSGSDELYSTDLTGSAAIVLGDEGKGISRLTRENCDYLMRIPMKGEITSLNISVAGALAMYEALRQRNIKDAQSGGFDLQ